MWVCGCVGVFVYVALALALAALLLRAVGCVKHTNPYGE
jgi:hypothetical protein